MKKVFLALMAVVLNTFLFSCSTTDTAEIASEYDMVATEGDDQDPTPPPPPPPPPPGGGDQ